MARLPAAYGSDLVVDLLRAVGVAHVAINPGATFRGLHDSLVNHGQGDPELILTLHEEIAVALAHGYAKAKSAPMAAAVPRRSPRSAVSPSASPRRWSISRASLLTIMFNNRTYGNDEEHQEVVAKARGRPVENKVVVIRIDDPAPDFARIVAGFGVYAEGPIETADDVGPALRRALRVVKDGGPALVDVITRP